MLNIKIKNKKIKKESNVDVSGDSLLNVKSMAIFCKWSIGLNLPMHASSTQKQTSE